MQYGHEIKNLSWIHLIKPRLYALQNLSIRFHSEYNKKHVHRSYRPMPDYSLLVSLFMILHTSREKTASNGAENYHSIFHGYFILPPPPPVATVIMLNINIT
jgi:hypothetical protein